MEDSTIILVSNQGIPNKNIGSWTNRITNLIKNNEVFDYILSPSNLSPNGIYCKKRKFLTYKQWLRSLVLTYWVAYDYIKCLRRISKKTDKLIIVIIDDLHLLEAIIQNKHKFCGEVELIFSFHGFRLELEFNLLKEVNKLLFLSELSLEAFRNDKSNLPICICVGNGVNSKVFYPLEKELKTQRRSSLNYNEDDEIIVWAANDRPKKGISIFYKVISRLFTDNPRLKVIIIGSDQQFKHTNVLNVGKINNDEVARYMQIGNYYFFTSLYEEGFGLSLIEAYKAGNAVISATGGAIPEVLSGLEFTYPIENPLDIDAWVDTFELVRKETNFGKNRITKEIAHSIWHIEEWEKKFIDSIK